MLRHQEVMSLAASLVYFGIKKAVQRREGTAFYVFYKKKKVF